MKNCDICGGSLCVSEIWRSGTSFAVSSDNRLVNDEIVVYECCKCGHLQKFPKMKF